MRILVIGSCRSLHEKPNDYRKDATLIGKELAKRGHRILTGRAGGMKSFVVKSYRDNRGKSWTLYLAKGEDKEKIPTEPHIKPDKLVKTGLNYTMRDAFYVGKCDAVVALSGRALTLVEIINAVKDYKIRVFQYDSGANIPLIKAMPELRDNVFITKDVIKGLDYVEDNSDSG